MKNLTLEKTSRLNPGRKLDPRSRVPVLKTLKILKADCLLIATLLLAHDGYSQIVDCNCLGNLPVLQTNACQGIIPDLCQFSQCWLTPAMAPCSQSPAAGGQVGSGSYPITVMFIDPFGGQTQVCNVTFVVNPLPGGCGCVPAPQGLAAWWPLDEGCGAGVFAEISGNGNAAVVEPNSLCSG